MDEQITTAAGALVGRQRELGEVLAAIEAGLAGTGGLVLVTGEAGIGKSRLLEAAAARTSALTLWGACWDDPGTPAFWPWTTVLRDCAAARGLEPGDDLAPVLGQAGATSGPARQLRLRMFDSVMAFLRTAADGGPLVIVLEDLHLADEASLDLLRFLVTTLRSRPVAIVGSFRYPDLEPGAPLVDALAELGRIARSVALSGLDQDDVGTLMGNTLGRRPSERLAARVRERTGGNPLFVNEVAKLLAVTGRFDPAQLDTERIPIPPSVRQVIAHRLSFISGDALDVLAQASVVGQVFSERVLTHVTGESPSRLADLLDEANEARLVQPLPTLGWFGFTHALTHDVLYAGIPAAVRRAQHRRVAEAIEALHRHDLDDHLDELADHSVLALPDADPGQALEYSRRAGRRALGMLAYEQAARHFAHAVELAERARVDEADRVELLLVLGDARLRAGDWQGATAAYDEAAASARRRRRPDELARAALGLGAGLSGFEVRLFDQRQLDLLREAVDALGEEESDLRAWVLARLSVAESFLVPEDVRVERSAAAVASARSARAPKLLVYALSSYCDAISGPAHTEQRLALADEMVRLGITARDAESELLGRRFRFVALLELGDVIAAAAEIDAFARTASRLRWPLVEWYPLLWRGTLALIEGRLDAAERLGGQVREIGRRAGSVNAEIVADAQRLQLLLERGRPGDAYALLGRFLDDPEGGPNAEAWLALPLARMGRRAEAVAVLDKFTAGGFALVMDAAWLEVVAGAAEAAAVVGHSEAAQALLPTIAPYADCFATGATGGVCLGSMCHPLALLAQCLGRLDAADVYFRRALAAHRRAGAALLTAHTLRLHAALLAERGGRGDHAEAANMLAEANQTFQQLGLDHWVPREAGPVPAAFHRDGDTWLVRYERREARVRHAKGMQVLARLLAEPGREFHVLDLLVPGGRPAVAADTGDVIDAQARRAYQRRLAELDAELDDAAVAGDSGRAELFQRERDALVDQLATAYGLGGRARHGNDPIERARSTVTKQIHHTVARIESVHPELGRHLVNAVKTGRYCRYAPERAVTWQL